MRAGTNPERKAKSFHRCPLRDSCMQLAHWYGTFRRQASRGLACDDVLDSSLGIVKLCCLAEPGQRAAWTLYVTRGFQISARAAPVGVDYSARDLPRHLPPSPFGRSNGTVAYMESIESVAPCVLVCYQHSVRMRACPCPI